MLHASGLSSDPATRGCLAGRRTRKPKLPRAAASARWPFYVVGFLRGHLTNLGTHLSRLLDRRNQFRPKLRGGLTLDHGSDPLPDGACVSRGHPSKAGSRSARLWTRRPPPRRLGGDEINPTRAALPGQAPALRCERPAHEAQYRELNRRHRHKTSRTIHATRLPVATAKVNPRDTPWQARAGTRPGPARGSVRSQARRRSPQPSDRPEDARLHPRLVPRPMTV